MSAVEIIPRLSRQPFKFVVSFLSQMNFRSERADCDEDENRARRAFILEMMDAHPDAFQHELDFQTMMQIYPSRF